MMFTEKKKIPGPPHYSTDNLKIKKTPGFYDNTETKFSMTGSVAFEKKFIPGPNAYESRGRSMT